LADEHWRHLAGLDPLSLDQLMAEYGQTVWNYAFLLVKHRAMADDVTQDVFLKAYRRFGEYRGEASVKTWLLRITHNVSMNYLRSAFFRRALLVDRIRGGGTGASAEQEFIEREAAGEVWRQVFRLPAKYREVLVLQAKYGLNIAEIAAILDIPEGTVKSRLFTARKRLSAMLSKEEMLHEPT
jgi:RNA polymerase sigma-70 factor, ECF subfamily